MPLVTTGDMDGLDVVGDGTEGDVLIGRHHGRHHMARAVPTPRWQRNVSPQGVSLPQEELDVLPFQAAIIGNTTDGVVAGQSSVLVATPQRPFRGERLVLGAILSNGNDASNAVVINPAIYVGAVQVGADQGSMPISAFAATAFGVRLSFPPAGQGTRISIFVQNLVTVASVVLTVTGVLYGRAMR